MSDYISRQAAIEAVDECTKLKITDDFYTVYTEDMKDMITDIPAADVRENVKGEWQITDAYPHNVYCSNCHKKFAQTHWAVWEDGSLPRNYCPNCGSDMRGEA